MYFLVIDDRFGTPIYAFLELDPRGACEAIGLTAWEVALELPAAAGPPRLGRRPAIGRDPYHLDCFREFASDGAAARAGFIVVEPRYVGPSWDAYEREFRPQGEKPAKRPTGRPRPTAAATPTRGDR
jgi:hypothetical protein